MPFPVNLLQGFTGKGFFVLRYIFQGIRGSCAVWPAIILMGRLTSANAALGEGLELKVIAGVVVGALIIISVSFQSRTLRR